MIVCPLSYDFKTGGTGPQPLAAEPHRLKGPAAQGYCMSQTECLGYRLEAGYYSHTHSFLSCLQLISVNCEGVAGLPWLLGQLCEIPMYFLILDLPFGRSGKNAHISMISNSVTYPQS